MMAFLNEGSICAHGDLRNELIFFWRAAIELQKSQAKLYRNSHFYFTPEFARRFNALAFPGGPDSKLPPDLRSRLREVAFSDRFWKCWRGERVSVEADFYSCQTPEHVASDSSLGEATERKLLRLESEVGILSAVDSAFRTAQRLRVTKVGSEQPVELHNSVTILEVGRWIGQQRGHFDPNSNMVPMDYQTILEQNPQRFRRTGRIQRVGTISRNIYEETATGRQFYVDGGHSGHSAHLEVFDSDGNHLGQADIATGTVDFSEQDSTKRITL